MTQSRRILVTSALPYINGVKHLGNLAGSIIRKAPERQGRSGAVNGAGAVI